MKNIEKNQSVHALIMREISKPINAYTKHTNYIVKIPTNMNRLLKLENICQKIGIFTVKQYNGEKRLTFGPYAQMLLNEIKSQWLKSSIIRYNSHIIMNSNNMLTNEQSDFDLDFFSTTLQNTLNVTKLPFGIVNVVEGAKPKSENFKLFKHLTKLTELNFIYLNDSEEKDTFSLWQTERRRWWSRHMQKSINLTILNSEDDHKFRFESSLIYSMENFKDLKCEIASKTVSPRNFLEKILYFSDVNKSEFVLLKEIFKRFENPSSKGKRDLLIAQTSCESILENLIIDSMEIPDEEHLKKIESFNLRGNKNEVFALDFRMAPYKACILYNSKAKHDVQKRLSDLANDLKKTCYLNSVNVHVMILESDEKSYLKNKFAHLDLIGMPFSIYLPPTIVKDGICLVRNRDTDISETMQIATVAKDFKSFSDSLFF